MRSIRSKLCIGMSCLVLLYIGITWVLNTQYLAKYYVSKKQDILIHSSQVIDGLYTGDPTGIARTLEQLESTMGVVVGIIGQDGKTKYSSIYRLINGKPFFPENLVAGTHTPESRLATYQLTMRQVINDKLTIETRKDPVLNREYLVLESKLSAGDTLVLRVHLSAIEESVAIANQFMMFTGILVILFGSLWTVIFSKRFTQPIIQLKDIAHRMASLDFSKKCQVRGNDEVAELAASINYLSDQLDLAIRELNRKNRMLTEDIKKERQIDHMRKEFISNVSHELKTPLSLILGYAEGLKENVNEDEANKDFYCSVIIDEARKMDKMVKDLLSLAQLESEHFQLDKTQFDIAALVEQVLNKYQALFAEKGIQLTVQAPKGVIVHADRTKTEQVIINYINNALHHVDHAKMISVALTPRQNKVRLSVTNSGSHIPEDCLDKIWTSFYRVDKARSREDGRVGLGLAIVKAIQERYHNQFGVENVDQGVKFWFDLDTVT